MFYSLPAEVGGWPLPDGLPEPGRELLASLASLTVLSAKVAARAEGIPEGEYLDSIIRLWTDSPR